MTKPEHEVLQALDATRSNQDFLVKGGAGSGKTHSMLGFLDEIYAERPRVRVACVTFTNVAVNEIRARFSMESLQISTIHDFLWSLISRYQKNLKDSLAKLVNSGAIKSTLALPINTALWTEPIKYREWLNIEAGEVSHDEVLKLAEDIFSTHTTMARILTDCFDYLLVDEYQDTPAAVMRILVDLLPAPTDRSMRVGLFGDSEQAIHESDNGRDLLEGAIQSGRIRAITKTENRRNPAAVLQVINRLRADGLQQIQSIDPKAPNCGVEGTARFVYTTETGLDTATLRQLSLCDGWDFSPHKTKLLYLSKNMIARENRFPQLMRIYDKDRVVEYAKKVRAHLEKTGMKLAGDATLGSVLEDRGRAYPPSGVQAKELAEEPQLLENASSFRFEDIATTPTSSDRLIGTKRVSEFDDRNRGDKRDALINHLLAIQSLRSLYKQGKFNQVIRCLDVNLDSIEARRQIAASLDELAGMDSRSIGEVFEFAHQTGLIQRDDRIRRFETKHPYRCTRVFAVPFHEVVSLFEYVEDFTPYSTQHGVKGSEWDNIFISLDNGGWNNYNFEKLLANPTSTESVPTRSRMMLYVTCSRAKQNLVVYAHDPSETTLARAREWFGEDSVLCVSGQ
ncbi:MULTISPECIES: UvrD-helicase domain-containing protein [unclassified Arthrobacter]|uniref:UvrD-helicase domain-containing protein n=1 Tax=unclassified Arthrobacter TaxID=235627 RepID=UPI0028834ED8|nr:MULTISPECIES: UvrD-helicase domain-containing protein [unclassified Arthrobacter]